MSLVRVKTKGQVTIPTDLRRRAGLNVGDFLDARLERGKLTLTPQTPLDRDIADSIKDLKAGRTYGPFDTVDELTRSLKAGRRRKSTNKSKQRA
jgi:bifunctional DNA-binding transcriptional regulator/antitoxin component of YhaV-PrlF toxin-antitoxin module